MEPVKLKIFVVWVTVPTHVEKEQPQKEKEKKEKTTFELTGSAILRVLIREGTNTKSLRGIYFIFGKRGHFSLNWGTWNFFHVLGRSKKAFPLNRRTDMSTAAGNHATAKLIPSNRRKSLSNTRRCMEPVE